MVTEFSQFFRLTSYLFVRYSGKAVAPAGSIIYLQDERGSKYSQYPVPEDDLPDHHTEMVNGELRMRACVKTSKPNQEPSCTGFIQGLPS